MSFKVQISQTCTDSVSITNTGSTAIYYNWVKHLKPQQEMLNDSD